MSRDRSAALRLLRDVVLVWLVTFGFYAATSAPEILWADSALFVYRVWHADLAGNLGLALSHPLYILYGILAGSVPWGGFAHRISLVSAFFGAVAVSGLFLVLRIWFGRQLPALVGSVSLAVSWTFWQHAVIPEVYSLFAAHLFGELALLLLFVRRGRVGFLYGLALLNGLSLSNHVLALFGTAVYACYVALLLRRGKVRPRQAVTYGVLTLVGAGLYLSLIGRMMIETGDVGATFASALFGQMSRGSVLNLGITGRTVLENFAFMALNLPTPNLLLLLPGVAVVIRRTPDRPFVWIAAILMALHLAFAFRYVVPDRFSFFLSFYCLAALFLGAGAAWFTERRPGRSWAAVLLACSLLPALVYEFTPDLARRAYPQLGERRPRPYRDEYRYYLRPDKHDERGAARGAREALSSLPPGAILYAFPTDVHPLLYTQEAEGLRPDVRIVSATDRTPGAPAIKESTFDALVTESEVFFLTVDRRYLPEFVVQKRNAYTFTPAGLVHRVRLASAAPGSPGP